MRKTLPWLPSLASAHVGAAGLGLERVDPREGGLLGDVLGVAVLMVVAVMAGIIASHERRNAVGWLLGCLAATTTAFASTRYVIAAYDGALVLPSAEVVGWPGTWLWLAGLAAPAFIAFVVPTGRTLTPGWGRALTLVALTFLAVGIVFALGSPAVWTAADTRDSIPNPYDVPALRPAYDVVNAAYVLYVALFATGAASLLVRFRRSRGIERQQLRWVLAAIGR